jgi:hypothetical protein
MDTGRRCELKGQRFANLIAWTEAEEAKHDVVVRWDASGGIDARPEVARIGYEDLLFYPKACRR